MKAFYLENEYYFQEIFSTNKISISASHNSIFLVKTYNIKKQSSYIWDTFV